MWGNLKERVVLGPKLIQETMKKNRSIQEKLKAIQSLQKSYADFKRHKLEFQVGDFIFLKVPHRHGVFRFGVKGKLVPRSIGLFEVT